MEMRPDSCMKTRETKWPPTSICYDAEFPRAAQRKHKIRLPVTLVFSELRQSAQTKKNALTIFFITFLVAAEVMKFLCLNEVIVLLVTITGAFSGESNKKCVNVLTRTMLLLLFLHIGIGIFFKVVFNVISSFLLNVYVVNRLIRNLTYTKHKTNTIAFNSISEISRAFAGC